MSIRRRAWLVFTFTAACLSAFPASAVDGPLLMFGGRDHGEFLGCLNCYRSEPFSVWNESGEYGNPGNENSIWNQKGPYGSRTSPVSPWNPRSSEPPLVVDRLGNLYGYFTLNRGYPKRIQRNDTHHRRGDFKMMAWLLDNYDWVVSHLDEVRVQYDVTPDAPIPTPQ
jgi:hypothetical protein